MMTDGRPQSPTGDWITPRPPMPPSARAGRVADHS